MHYQVALQKSSALAAIVGSLGLSGLASAESPVSLVALGGRVQSDYRMYLDDDEQNADTFDIRRAYVQATGKLYDDFKFVVVGNFAGSSASLVYAYIDANITESANLVAGQFKMPMGLEELTSSRFINFQERSLPMQFVPALDRGLMLHGEPSAGAYYAVSVSNGSGANKTEPDAREDGKDVTGRLVLNLAQMFGSENAIYHFGGAVSTGETSSVGSGLRASTEARGVRFFSTTEFSGDSVERDRTALETALAMGPVKLQAEYVSVGFSGVAAEGEAFDRDIDSYYASVNWMITGESYAKSYKGYKFDRMKPNSNAGQGGWGGWEIGVRYSELDAADFTTANAAGTGVLAEGATNQANALTFGVKWLVNPNVRALFNYIKTEFDEPIDFGDDASDSETALTARLQLDF